MILDALIGTGAGMAAGLVFFGGLSWTLSRLVGSRRPLPLAAASFLLRSAFVVAVFLLMADGGLSRILGGLVGMLAVRTILVSAARRRLDPAEESSWT
jgi:F1F0 ATPase subunit 2